MKKFLLYFIHIILLLIGLSASYYRSLSDTSTSELIVYLAIIVLCALGFVYSMMLMKKLGGRKSIMGKSFLYLGLAFFFQAITIVYDYLFFSLADYSPVSTLLLAIMNLCWAISIYNFFLITGVSQKIRQAWKTILIIGIVICCSLAAYGNLPVSYADEFLSMAILLVNVILIFESALLLLYSSRFRGGALLMPVLLLCFGIVFQLVGDLLNRGVFQVGTITYIADDAFYCFSWFLLSMSPTILLAS